MVVRVYWLIVCYGSRVVDAQGVETAGDERRYTVDELAQAAGLPSRTVRHYQSEGVLPPPEDRKGRIALYNEAHLERLRLIAHLQDRGLKLAAIRDALRAVEKGELSFEEWLGVGEQLLTPWSHDSPIVLNDDELQRRLDERPPGAIAALVDAGLVTRQGDGPAATFLVPSPALLDLALRLDAAGVDVATSTGALERVRKQIRKASDDLVGFFLERTGDGFGGSGSADDLAASLEALRTLGVELVRLAFAREMERALRTAADSKRFPRPRRSAPSTSASDD